jgi:hypothetical protein
LGNDSAPERPSADPVRGVGGDTPAASASHDAVLTQPRDRSVVETEPVGKHFGGVLAEQLNFWTSGVWRRSICEAIVYILG